jgi:ribosomal protein RSM22 (predicted rRNA methylase)
MGDRQRHVGHRPGSANARVGRRVAPAGDSSLTITLPPSVQDAVESELAGYPASSLSAASRAVSDDYAAGRASALADEARHAAYLAVRLPATYAAVVATLAMVPAPVLDEVTSMLDLGAGPGTATWAALASCPRLVDVMQIDRSQALLAIAARVAARAFDGRAISLAQRTADIGADRAWPTMDLVIAAYSVAELSSASQSRVLHAAWAATGRLLVIVEPGTPAGFERIHEARSVLVGAGGHIVAPCPHEGPCPMRTASSQRDWCHFAVRVPRSKRHRLLKGGTLGYEDEKYACLVVTRQAGVRRAATRVLRHPRTEKGRVTLELCTPGGAVQSVVTRRDETWRAARKVEWGEAWDEAAGSHGPSA